MAFVLAPGLVVIILVDEVAVVPIWGFRSWVLLVFPVWAGGLIVVLLGEVITGLWSCAGSIRPQSADGPVFAGKGATAPIIFTWDYLTFVGWEHRASGPWVGGCLFSTVLGSPGSSISGGWFSPGWPSFR